MGWAGWRAQGLGGVPPPPANQHFSTWSGVVALELRPPGLVCCLFDCGGGPRGTCRARPTPHGSPTPPPPPLLASPAIPSPY